MKTLLVLIALLLSSCAFGPFEIYHEEGSLPKGRVNITDSCKVRGRYSGDRSNARYTCKWYIDESFNLVRK